MEIKGKVHLFFEQSATFRDEFRKLGYQAECYDIQNNFGKTDHVIDLFSEIDRAYDNLTRQDKTRQDKTRQDKTRQYSTQSTLVKTLSLRSIPVFTFVRCRKWLSIWATQITDV